MTDILYLESPYIFTMAEPFDFNIDDIEPEWRHEYLPTVEQDNIKGGKKPIDLRPAHKPINLNVPSIYSKESLVAIRRQNFEVV